MLLGTLIYGFVNSVILALVALGFNLTFGISGVANFAYGALYILAGFLSWVLFNSVGLPYVFAALFGISYGGNIVLIPKLTANIFGLRSMGAIFGGLSVADGLGFGTGPLLAGYVFDATGSYDISFLIVGAGMMAAAVLTFILKEAPAKKKWISPDQPKRRAF